MPKQFARTIVYNKLKLNNAITSIYILCWFSLFLIIFMCRLLRSWYCSYQFISSPLYRFNWLFGFFMRKQWESILVFHVAEKNCIEHFVRLDIESAFYINTLSYVKLPVIASEQLSYETNRKGSFSCELFLCAPISWRDLAIDWKPCKNKYCF